VRAVVGDGVGEEGGAGDEDGVEGPVVGDSLGVVGVLVLGPGGGEGGGGGGGGVGGEEEGGGEGEEGGGLEGGGGHGGVLQSGLMDRFFPSSRTDVVFFGSSCRSRRRVRRLWCACEWCKEKMQREYRMDLYRSLKPRSKKDASCHGSGPPC
jgi:hypothetical protein